MSFFDIESQKASTSREGADYDTDSGNSSDILIAELARQLKVLERESNKIGTKKDSLNLRSNIETGLIPNCNSIRDKLEEQVWHSSPEIVSGSKLYNDFQMLKNEFINFERSYTDKKMKNILRKPSGHSNSPSIAVRKDPESRYVSIQVDEQTPLLLEEGQLGSPPRQENQQQQQYGALQQDTINQDELDFNTIIQQERSQQINNIHSAVQEVNAIFHQLGSLVSEQGEQVDTIDGNIGQLSGNMQKANEQLNKAEEHQRKRNKCGLISLVIMVVVVLVIILAALG